MEALTGMEKLCEGPGKVLAGDGGPSIDREAVGANDAVLGGAAAEGVYGGPGGLGFGGRIGRDLHIHAPTHT